MHIDEIITDASGLRSHKFPQEEADRIERLLKGDIASDDELVEIESIEWYPMRILLMNLLNVRL